MNIYNQKTDKVALNREEKIKRVVEGRQEGIIVLEDIHDPHNIQAVVRSADAFGFQKIYLIFEKEEKFNPKRIGKSSSSSANKWVDYKVFDSRSKCLEELKDQGYEIWATVLDSEAKTIGESKFVNKKIAIMLGNEHQGLSKEAVEKADKKIYIPMKGMVQSLNISVAAAIILYEINRQREEIGIDNFFLDKEERLSLSNLFTHKR